MNSFTLKQSTEISSSIDDLIKCYICLCKIQDACMCPYCQKLACQRCLYKWLREKKSCPQCRMSLKESQVIKVSFMNEVATYLDKINSNKKNEKTEICKKHQIKFLYYCITCKTSLCSDCCLFEDEHKSHHIQKLKEIYNEHLKLVKTESQELENKYFLLNKNLVDLQDKIKELTVYKNKRSRELADIYDNLKQDLESRIQEISFNLSTIQNDIFAKLTEIEKGKKNIEKEINECSQSELIAKSDEMIKKIIKIKTDANDEKLSKNYSLNLSTEIPSLIFPSFETSYFEIQNFSEYLALSHDALIKSGKEIVYSPEMRINGIIWRIKLYPKGNSAAKGEYISIFLELIEGVTEAAKYIYKIELINFSGNKNFKQEYSSSFVNGECWGYSKFYQLERLERDGFIDHDTGKIGFKIYIKPENFAQLVRDLKNYINILEEKIPDNESSEDKNADSLEMGDYCNKTFNKKIKNMNIAKDIVILEKNEDNNKRNNSVKDKKIKNVLFEREKDKDKEKEKEKENKENVIIKNNNKNNNINNILQKDSDKNKNDFHILTQNSEPVNEGQKDNDNLKNDINSLSKDELKRMEDLTLNLNSLNLKKNKFQLNNNFIRKKQKVKEDDAKKKDQGKIKGVKGSNKISNNHFQIDFSMDSDSEIKQNLIIPKKKENDSMSEDSYNYLVDSLKAIDEKNPSQKNKNQNNNNELKDNDIIPNYRSPYIGNNLISSSNNNAFNKYFNLHLNMGITDDINSGALNLKNSGINPFDFKQKFNFK